MKSFARRRLRDPEEADDLVSEAFRILSERDDLNEIRNPAAFLMTVLQRQINSHLRRKYRRKHTSLEDAEADIPASPDIAESYEEQERAALVAEFVKQIRSPRQKRALDLYSLNYKAGEIAAMETASGKPTTSHQASCVVQGGLANLKTQFRRKGYLPSFIPIPLFLRLRSRIETAIRDFGDHFRLFESGAALQIVVLVSVASMLKSTFPEPVTHENRPPHQHLSNGMTVGLASTVLPSPDPTPRSPAIAGKNMAAEGPRQSADDPGPVAPPDAPGHPALQPTAESRPVQIQGAPSAHLSKDEERDQATVHVAPKKEDSTEYERPQEAPGAAPLQDQVLDLVQDPSELPRPQCGGLPPICDDEPPPEYQEPNHG